MGEGRVVALMTRSNAMKQSSRKQYAAAASAAELTWIEAIGTAQEHTAESVARAVGPICAEKWGF